MGRKTAGYELAATRLLNRGRKLSNDPEQRAQAELLISAANAFALLDLASAVRGQDDSASAAEASADETAETEDVGADEEPAEPSGQASASE